MAHKVLCLHGYSMDVDWLREWFDPLEAMLEGQAEFIYPQGPIEVPEESVREILALFKMPLPESRIGPGKNWCWYRASSDKPPVYQGVEETLQWFDKLFEREKPVSGVIGWSQGAVMAALLAGLRRDDSRRYPFNWAVLAGGFLPGDTRYRGLFTSPLDMPTLHITGEKESDFMKAQGEKMVHAFLNSERLITPVGHVMPVKYPDYMERIAQWIRRQLGTTPAAV